MFKSINRYIVKEFLKSLLVVLCVMFSIVLLITLLEEFNYFKSKQDLKFIQFIIFTFLKIPNLLFNLFPFVVLFSGIVFYLKIYNYNEVISLGVPEESVVQQGNTAIVYKIIDNQTVARIEVKTGVRNLGDIQIISGLTEGDQIIVQGVSKVRDKSKIKLISK